MYGVPGQEGGGGHLASRRNTRPAQELDPGYAARPQLELAGLGHPEI